jgi:hypothetical protein
MANQDWNAIIWILDTLSEDVFSFTELDDCIGRVHGRDVIRESLGLLVKQDLICFLEGPAHGTHVPIVDEGERSKRIERFFEIADADRRSSVANWVDLTEAGKELLKLIGIGHP